MFTRSCLSKLVVFSVVCTPVFFGAWLAARRAPADPPYEKCDNKTNPEHCNIPWCTWYDIQWPNPNECRYGQARNYIGCVTGATAPTSCGESWPSSGSDSNRICLTRIKEIGLLGDDCTGSNCSGGYVSHYYGNYKPSCTWSYN